MNGHDQKQSAHASLETSRAELILRARRVFLTHAIKYGEVCADDVHRAIDLPSNVDPKALGPVPNPLASVGIVVRVGYRNSTRADAHSRPISIWQLADRMAAERWLDEHPEPLEEHSHPRERQGSLFDLGGQGATQEGW